MEACDESSRLSPLATVLPQASIPGMSLSLRSSKTPPLTVPLEIQFLILDHLNDGTAEPKIEAQQLRRLAFICSAWAAHIQSLLFRHVAIESNGERDRFLSLLRGSTHLAQYTTTLTSLGDVFNTLAIQNLLPNLRTVHLRAYVFGSLPARAAHWSTVTCLCLRFCMLSTTQHMWDLLALFPRCECLVLAGWMYSDLPTTTWGAVTSAKHLKSLAFKSSWNSSPQTAAACLAPGALTVDRLSLVLGTPGDDDASEFNALLSRIGHALKALEITELPVNAEPVVGICLTPCTALRSLTVSLYFSTASSHKMVTGLLALLQHAAAPDLETLTVVVALTPGLLDLPWAELDAVFAGRHFDGLTELVFRGAASPSSLVAEFEAGIRGAMLGVRERGLLRFESSAC
ncbi:hypothetical protein FB451DRAFT_1527883 [Mycena latifolia]|nr:hypothetical protein FB451DRAFT_1527883 [Mycena latifolia]